MGRGQGPQGGAGNQGGALSSKSSKPRKPRPGRSKSFKTGVAASGSAEEGEPAAPAFSVVRPQPKQRAEVMRAQRDGDVLLEQIAAKKSAAARVPVNGTAPSGAVLGGELALGTEDLRRARLQRLATMESTASRLRKETLPQRSPSATKHAEQAYEYPTILETERQAVAQAVAKLPFVRRRCVDNGAVEDEDGEGHLGAHVMMLMEMLTKRLRQEDVKASVKLLGTVLANATKEDPKYRRLRATNNKLWLAILQHPELSALIEAAGFQQHTAEAVDEMDRSAEMEEIQRQLQDQLEADDLPAQMTVESLLSRLEALQVRPPSTTPPVLRLHIHGDAVGRSAVFVHPGAESLVDLAVVLEIIAGWSSDADERDEESTVNLHPNHAELIESRT